MIRRPCQIIVLTIITLTLSATSALAQLSRLPPIARGLAVVQDKCSGCHAIGTADASPLSQAPPFRDLHKKYNVEGLAEALAEGIVTGHDDMPAFVFDPPDVDAIIQYLKSLQ